MVTVLIILGIPYGPRKSRDCFLLIVSLSFPVAFEFLLSTCPSLKTTYHHHASRPFLFFCSGLGNEGVTLVRLVC